jgi:hypothetical protein
LQRIFEEDQADRRGGPGKIDWEKVAPRDASRLRRTTEVLASGGARAAEDFYRAAMILLQAAELNAGP